MSKQWLQKNCYYKDTVKDSMHTSVIPSDLICGYVTLIPPNLMWLNYSSYQLRLVLGLPSYFSMAYTRQHIDFSHVMV